MHRRTTFWLIVCLSQCVCPAAFSQEARQSAPDAGAYLVFFRAVTAMRLESDRIANGEDLAIRHLTPRQVIGLTDPETRALNAIAEDCEARIQPIAQAARALTFEARLRAVQSQDPSEWLATRQKELDRQVDEVVRDQVQLLKAQLGASRFDAVDAYVRSKENGPFFPVIRPERLPVVRRKQ